MVCVMENTSDTPSAVSTSDTGNNNKSEPVISAGTIADVGKFVAIINSEVERLCSTNKKWATDETTEIMLHIFDMYLAQLPTVNVDVDGKAEPAVLLRSVDVADLTRYVRNFANMNATYNRYAAAKRIPVAPKGATRTAGRDLF